MRLRQKISLALNISSLYKGLMMRSFMPAKVPKNYAFYLSEKKKELAIVLEVEPINLPPISVFIGNGYLQPA